VSYLLDTNVVSELRKGQRCNPNVASWFATIDDDALYLSVLVVGEIRLGIERARPRDPMKATSLEAWLESLIAEYAERILPIDRSVAETWGRLSAIRPIPTVDGLLAATVLVHNMTLATRNTRDIADTGARLIDPFAARR
jgi:toxin FitB